MTKDLAPPADPHYPDDNSDDERDHPLFADPDELTAETYPHLRNVSVAFMFKRIARALEPAPPEYVRLPLERLSSVEHQLAIAKWNMLWESGSVPPPVLRRG